ncbi:MAG: nucleoside deaminase [Bacteroidales bacterium]|nr:nucleoside deaminase [Bacteroidales bacterium]
MTTPPCSTNTTCAANTTDDIRFMRQALVEAEAAYSHGEIPVGAVIVCQNRIIARAHNLTQLLNDVTAHAEMQAITSAANHIGGKYLNDCTLYVTLEPCVMCAGAIAWAQMGRLVFGASDPKRGYRLFAPEALHPKTTVTSGVLADDCTKLMKSFFSTKR